MEDRLISEAARTGPDPYGTTLGGLLRQAGEKALAHGSPGDIACRLHAKPAVVCRSDAKEIGLAGRIATRLGQSAEARALATRLEADHRAYQFGRPSLAAARIGGALPVRHPWDARGVRTRIAESRMWG